MYRPFIFLNLSHHVITNTHLECDFQMRAIIWPSLQISTPSAVLRFDSVVGRKPATYFTLVYLHCSDNINPIRKMLLKRVLNLKPYHIDCPHCYNCCAFSDLQNVIPNIFMVESYHVMNQNRLFALWGAAEVRCQSFPYNALRITV